jgi:hypothetical protein
MTENHISTRPPITRKPHRCQAEVDLVARFICHAKSTHVLQSLWRGLPCGPGNLIESRPLGLQAPLNPARPDLGSFTTEGEAHHDFASWRTTFARGMVRRREECRPLAPGIPTVHARTPINTDLSRKLCAIAAAGETPANGAANGSMHSLRAILNNPMAISPNTDPSRRVASGWEPHHKNTDRSRKNRR